MYWQSFQKERERERERKRDRERGRETEREKKQRKEILSGSCVILVCLICDDGTLPGSPAPLARTVSHASEWTLMSIREEQGPDHSKPRVPITPTSATLVYSS